MCWPPAVVECRLRRVVFRVSVSAVYKYPCPPHPHPTHARPYAELLSAVGGYDVGPNHRHDPRGEPRQRRAHPHAFTRRGTLRPHRPAHPPDSDDDARVHGPQSCKGRQDEEQGGCQAHKDLWKVRQADCGCGEGGRRQGLTLVHFSALLERFVLDRGCAEGLCKPMLRGC